MATISEMTLRIDILREARDRYDSLRRTSPTHSVDYKLAMLKIAECEAMLEELFEAADHRAEEELSPDASDTI